MIGPADRILAGLPGALRDELDGLRPLLEVEGCVQVRNEPDRRTTWRLRFHGEERRHRSLPLPDEDAAERVKTVIALWRQEREQREQEAAEAARLAAMSENEQWAHRRRDELSVLRGLAVSMAGGGRRRRKRAAERFDKACEAGPVALFYYAVLSGWAEPSPAGGRPREAGLW